MGNLDVLCDLGYEDAMVFKNPDYEEAILGVTYDGNVVYDFDLMVNHLMKYDGMTEMDAVEFIDQDVMRVIPYMGEYPPIIMYTI